MNILHIIPNLKKGGAERLAIDICLQLSKTKTHNVVLVYLENLNEYEEFTKELTTYLIESRVIPSITSRNTVNVDDLNKFIKNFKPDIIHTHLFEAEFVSRFCIYPKASWFSHVHDNMIQFTNWSWSNVTKVAFTNWYEKKILFKNYQINGGTHFIAISKHADSFIKSVQTEFPVTLLHNAINVKRFQKPVVSQNFSLDQSLTNDQLHKLNNKSHDPKLISLINIGSFVPKKNQTFLIDVILELNKRGIQTNCYFLGDGPLREEVENRARICGISNQCQFLGNVNNVEEYLWQSDIYVHTATYEPLGLVLIEAMAAGLPVITADGGGNQDLMINGKNGFLIEKHDPEIFSDRILEVYQNQEMKEFNTEFAHQFDIESYSQRLLEIYQN